MLSQTDGKSYWAKKRVRVSEVSNCTHHWLLDSDNVGRCKFCGEVRNFGNLQGHESKLLGLPSKRGGVRGKRSAAAKKLWQDPEFRARRGAKMKAAWQDPEYRAKQSAAHASLPGRHHKKEALV
ncbi:hypothetical protein ES707_00219 [subsurface metagenome]